MAAVKSEKVWYFGKIGKNEYNSAEKEYNIGRDDSKEGVIMLCTTQIGNPLYWNQIGKNKYQEIKNGLEVTYTYIDGGENLQIDWKYQKPKVKGNGTDNDVTGKKGKGEGEGQEQGKTKGEEYDINYLMGKYDPAEDNKIFIKIDEKYATKKNIYARQDVYTQLVNMIEAAKKDKITLKVISGIRTFNYQNEEIWKKKWKKYENIIDETERAKEILMQSSMPGTSRHHWGTDFDFNALENSYFQKGQGKKEYEWLANNAKKYGFIQVYKYERKSGEGYTEERWHWSYMLVAEKILKQYKEKVKYSDIKGFDGCKQAEKVKAIEVYVSTINRS